MTRRTGGTTIGNARTVAVLGMGNMGSAIAANLIADEFAVTVWNRSRDKAELFEDSARVADSPAEAVQGASVVITMLADDGALDSVAFGEKGLMGHLAPGAVHVSMSTVSPAATHKLSLAHQEADEAFIAAPVFGRPEAAAGRRLMIVPAGDDDVIARSIPYLERLGTIGFSLPVPEQANMVKLLMNFIVATTIEMLGEALAAAEKADLPIDRLLELLTGPLLGSRVVSEYAPRIAHRRFDPPGFALPLGRKDLRLALQAIGAVGAAAPLGEVVHARMQQAGLRFDHLDWSAVSLLAFQEDPPPGDRERIDSDRLP
jgi:3-hydroxyisobutyrate dehydrogenase-like beta-hydroxyacid dehydrogenase